VTDDTLCHVSARGETPNDPRELGVELLAASHGSDPNVGVTCDTRGYGFAVVLRAAQCHYESLARDKVRRC
jgi:hypothetical protein